MLLSIIILNYKKPDLTLACLASLHQQFSEEFTDKKFEIILVDNASEDGSVKKFQEEIKKKNYSQITLIANKENSGFSKGCNLGASKATGENLLFLNNDTLVKDKGIRNMVEYINKHSEVAILGGQLRNPDGSVQPSAGKFYTPFNALLLLLGMQRYGLLDSSPATISKVDWIKGAIFMIQFKVFQKLGGFDEKIFMYTEDMELCYRAKQAGYEVYFYPQVTIIHEEYGSSNRTFTIVSIYKNLLYFYKKHRSHSEYLFLRSVLRIKALVLIVFGRLTKNTYLIKTYEQALKVA